MRQWRLLKDGTSVWWQVQARNKKSVALDLRQAAAQDIVRRLADESDVLVENFRPGALESFGLDPAPLMQRNQRRIVLRISGYGQTGPYRDKPGFGVVREPAGSALPGIAPSNAYRCQDGCALIAGNGDSIFKRLMATIGRNDLAADPALASNTGSVARVAEIDAAIGAWAAPLKVEQVLVGLDAAAVPAGRIYTVADIAADPHDAARGMLDTVTLSDGTVLAVPGIVPKLSRTPGRHRRRAPELGQDSEDVLKSLQPASPTPRA